MGEYISHKGDVIKLGTCEDLFYIRFDDLADMIRDGAQQVPGNLEPADYLAEASGFRFRFPFPDEDHERDAAAYHDRGYTRGVIVRWPDGVLTEAIHDKVGLSMLPIGDREQYAYNVKVWVGCPMARDADPGQYSTAERILQVTQQKRVEGTLWVIVRCAYCGELWRLPPDQGRLLVASIRADWQGDDGRDLFYRTIADRIEAGYNRILDAAGPAAVTDG